MRRLSASAPTVTVRSRLPWPFRVVLGFVFFVLAAALGAGLYEYSRDLTGPGRRELRVELDTLRQQMLDIRAERDRLRAAEASFESQIKIEQAAQQELARQVGQLETERNRLRDDLAFFDSLLPMKADAKGVVVRSFRMLPDGEPGQWRYRVLVQQAGSKPETDFTGTAQLQITTMQGGKPAVIQLPDAARSDAPKSFELSFRHYQRLEGVVTLPAESTVRSVVVRILAAGRPIAQQSFAL